MSESPSVSFSTLVGGMRLDALLGEVLPGVSRRIAREACSNKTVRVNGRISKGGELVSARSVIEISQLNRQSSSRA
ncbi:MAG: hypothetical protein KDD66_11325, partial [Bdellovibrionales bacterium]|nr:hypothetical protein [Bdellovibrionales bacterium]